MRTFEDLQRGIIQIILDYHHYKTSDPDTSTWVAVSGQLQAAETTEELVNTLLTEDREALLTSYIGEATRATDTRKPLLESLIPILRTLDRAKAIKHTDEPDTYMLIYAELTEQLLALQAEKPSPGGAQQALNHFFSQVRNVHQTLALCFNEQTRAGYKRSIDALTLEKDTLERRLQEQAIQLQALQAAIDSHFPETKRASTNRGSEQQSKGFLASLTALLNSDHENSEYDPAKFPLGHDMY